MGEMNSEPKRFVQRGSFLLRVLSYLIHLLWESFRYLGKTVLDLVFAVRFLLLRRGRRRSPERAVEFDSNIASLREKRAKWWAEWYTLSGRRRLEIRLVALLIVVAIVFGLRSYITHPKDVAETVSSQSQTAHPESQKMAQEFTEEGKDVPSGDESETLSPQSQTERTDSKKIAKEFAEQIKASTTGQWIFYKGNPVLVRGELDQWDDFKVGSPVVLREGNHYRMWYRGCHFIGSEYTCGIGHAVSQDGVLWEKSPEPVFVPEDAVKSKQLHAVAVVRVGERYLMWYSVSADWFAGRHYATIYLATSTDGFNWKQEGAVLRAVNEGTTIEQTALYDGELFHLWYIASPYSGAIESILHVTSLDGKKWQIAGRTPLDIIGVKPGRLWVLSDGRGGYRGLFAYPSEQQNEKGLFGMLISADGNTWEKRDEGMNVSRAPLKKDVIADAPAVLLESGGFWMWFVLRPEDGAEAIGVAYRKEGTQ